MGFKDGTNNIKAEDAEDSGSFVWVGGDSDQAWMRGGTYLVARRIRMLIESWDRTRSRTRSGRSAAHKVSGAPLGGTDEFDPVDLDAKAPTARR